MTLPGTPSALPSAGARAPLNASVVGSRRCPVCQEQPIHGRQEVCSGKCRAALSRRRKAEAQRARDERVRELLNAALAALKENA